MLRHDYTQDEISEVYHLPLPDLIFRAQSEHRKYFPANKVQRSTLLSIKTGACSEDCAYCPQSAHHQTGVQREGLLPKEVVLQKAREARANGSTRFCMGAAWRQVKNGSDFDRVLEIVEGVSSLGLEVCCTLGMVTEEQAHRLKRAGCHAYNHNLDTSPEFYGQVISTRTYEERLQTLVNVRKAGITVCCGGIVGMGEGLQDRLGLLQQLASQNPHPESVPINMLVRVEGTPLFDQSPVDAFDFVRMVGTARIIMPASFVRLSAGRQEMGEAVQTLCFLAGANSIFAGEKLLTTGNPSVDQDEQLLKRLGMEFYSADEVREFVPK